ncbi:MAG: hypothetical protein ACFE7R_05440 [Candidatus Hodarchaeota archaeon]
MIVTVTTVVVLAIGMLSLILALYGGLMAIQIIEGLEGQSEEKHHSEQKYYLLGMIGIIVLTARLLNSPIFFWMMQSLVPYCPGAMCSYGVINVGSPYSSIAIVLKVLLPFAYGGWLFVELSNRREPTIPFIRTLAKSFLFVLLPLLLVDSAVDILFVAMIRPLYAPCCSSVYDIDPPFSPSAFLGPQIGLAILALTILASFILISIQWIEKDSRSRRVSSLGIACVAAILYLIALHDTYAPLVLGLSSHHCPYCLFQEFPDTAFFSAMFWVGVSSVGWRFIVQESWSRRGLQSGSIDTIVDLLRKVSTLALLFSMVSMLSHLSLVL